MDTQPENDASETQEATSIESTEQLSPQGRAAMQGNDTPTEPDLPMPEPVSDISPPPDKPTAPPTDQPLRSPNMKETAPETQTETRARTEKEQHSPIENEGGLHHQPSGRGIEG